MRFFGRDGEKEKPEKIRQKEHDPVLWTSASGAVMLRRTTVGITTETVSGAKLAIKELKLYKKELQIDKKQIAAELKLIRAERSDRIAHQGPMMRGGGSIGRTVRADRPLH